LELLNNACFNPELLGATRAIKALAVSISQPWIIEAYDTFTAQARSRIPRAVELEIDGFDTYTRDGSDENELLESQEAFYQDVLETELNKLSFPYVGVIIGALICLLGFWAFNLHIIAGIVGLGIGGVLTLNTVNNYNRAKKQIVENVEERKQKAKEVLRGCIAEVVDYRKEHSMEDSNAEKVRQLLISITPEDFSSVSKETARQIHITK
jgi:hypothetical protein